MDSSKSTGTGSPSQNLPSEAGEFHDRTTMFSYTAYVALVPVTARWDTSLGLPGIE